MVFIFFATLNNLQMDFPQNEINIFNTDNAVVVIVNVICIWCMVHGALNSHRIESHLDKNLYNWTTNIHALGIERKRNKSHSRNNNMLSYCRNNDFRKCKRCCNITYTCCVPWHIYRCRMIEMKNASHAKAQVWNRIFCVHSAYVERNVCTRNVMDYVSISYSKRSIVLHWAHLPFAT